MLKSEWINKQTEEIGENKKIKVLFECISNCLKETSINFEIEETKSVQDCFNEMEKYAEEHQENNFYCFSESEVEDFINKYLNIEKQEESNNEFINLSDFI